MFKSLMQQLYKIAVFQLDIEKIIIARNLFMRITASH